MTLHILRDPAGLPAEAAASVLAIGNFDGMHRGHRAVLAEAAAFARTLSRPFGLLTFEPHPRDFFRPDEPIFRLTPAPVKAVLAERLGAPLMVELTFDTKLAGLDAETFVREVLVGRFAVAGVAVGHDFHFGKGRSGNPDFLRDAGVRHGFEVLVVAPLAAEGVPVSSTAIRQHLAAGEIAVANGLLGYPWFVRAEVGHGDKRGRDLGYPTANLALAPACGLAHGIYAVRVSLDGAWRDGVASFGRRPTFDNGRPLLEVHVFDFHGDLYGRTLDVAFVAWLRGEEKFTDVAALVRQMDADSVLARRLLSA
jgi:riboflavin kinase/FMN adenylyltransferase